MNEIHKPQTKLTEVKSFYKRIYNSLTVVGKIKLKCWMYDSEERCKNKKHAFCLDYKQYRSIMDKEKYIEMVNSNLINCDDLGGKDKVIEELNNLLK